jgi:membrane protease YdiL (CAAX protease family)
MEMLSAGLVVLSVSAWNNALHLAPFRWRSFVVPVGVAGGGLAGAAWFFSRYEFESGLGVAWFWTLAAMAIAAAVVIVAHLSPAVGRILSDRRISEMSTVSFLTHTFLRIPWLTAVTEEILFRGVVWAFLSQIWGDSTALWGSSVAFGLAHVVVAVQQARREGYSLPRWVASTLASTTVAGLLLGGLRLLTGGIWASAGVHAAVNVILAIGARSVSSGRLCREPARSEGETQTG